MRMHFFDSVLSHCHLSDYYLKCYLLFPVDGVCMNSYIFFQFLKLLLLLFYFTILIFFGGVESRLTGPSVIGSIPVRLLHKMSEIGLHLLFVVKEVGFILHPKLSRSISMQSFHRMASIWNLENSCFVSYEESWFFFLFSFFL